MKEEILADKRPEDLADLMAKLRQVQSYTRVVPLGEAPIIRNMRKVPKKKRKRGYVHASEQDPIHSELVEAQVDRAQANKKNTRNQKGKGKSKPKARDLMSTSDLTSSDDVRDEPDPVTNKRKVPLRSTRAAKRVNMAESSESGESSSSDEEQRWAATLKGLLALA
jgi:hypothetical protein